MIEKLPINVNGVEKLASGITKETTIDDLKFAMLYATTPNFTADMLQDYGLFDKWQDNERLLDGRIKIYKLIRNWQSLPGDQLSKVKFMIRKKIHPKQHVYKFCALSPAKHLAWNDEKIQQKSSYVKKQLQTISTKADDGVSICSIPSSAWSSDCDEDLNSKKTRKRYASVKRTNRVRQSSIKRVSNEIDSKLNEKLNRINQLKKELVEIEKEFRQRDSEKDVKKLKKELIQKDSNILLKTQLIQSLEIELNKLSQLSFQEQDIQFSNSAKKSLSCSSSASSIKSTDTGICSAQSDDEFSSVNARFETLV